MAISLLTAALLFATSTATALRITDSSTADKGAGSTYSSLNKINTISTAGYQNTYGVPVGMIVAWSSQREISSYDSMKWLECNGQTFNRDQYPELYEALGVNVVPNLNGQFMRGTSDKNLVLTRKDDTIKSHTVNIPEHTHTFDLTATGTVQTLTNGETIYVPKLSSSDDYIPTERVEKVKSTIEYVCGMHEEEYECNCVEAKTETYQCGVDTSSRRFSYSARCYLMEYCGNYSYGTAGSFETYCDSEDNVQKCCIDAKNKTYPGGGVSGYVYNEGATYECSISVSSSQAMYMYSYKYCTRTIPRTCETCKKNVEDYCTKDIYIDKIEYGEKTPTAELSTLAPTIKSLNNGTVSGQINSSGELIGKYDGAEETAPKHTYVRYFIRAIP